MSVNEILPWVAGSLFLVITFWLINSSKRRSGYAWLLPLGLALLFLAWSATSIVLEGPLGFWSEHTRNMWGNQIWFDLLLAVGVAWAFILPSAKELEMYLLGWLLLILCTGSIGLLMMTARLLYLRTKLSA